MEPASSRLASLNAAHSRLDEEIRKEMAAPLPDTLRIQSLKRKKLRLKEAIQLSDRQDRVQSEAWQDWDAAAAVHQ